MNNISALDQLYIGLAVVLFFIFCAGGYYSHTRATRTDSAH